jgi:hypothetical protein
VELGLALTADSEKELFHDPFKEKGTMYKTNLEAMYIRLSRLSSPFLRLSFPPVVLKHERK